MSSQTSASSSDFSTIHLQDLLISSQSTSIILECLPGHLHHLGCLRNPLHHLWISSRPSLPYISRPISGHRHQHCMAQNPAMRSCNSPGSGYPSTDTCGYGSACRYPHFGGTWQQGYRHTYLYWHIDCQVNCTRGHVKGLYTQSTRSVSGEAGGPSKGVNAQMHRCLPETPIIWTCTCHKHICYRYPGPYPAGQELSLEADLTHEQLPSIAQFIHRKSRTSQSGTKLRECSVLGGSVPTAQSKLAQL